MFCQEGGQNLLEDLLTTVGACDRDDVSQAVGGMFHKLLLHSSLPAGVSPNESLVQVEETVERERERNGTHPH